MAVNKVIFAGVTLIDMTDVTVQPGTMLAGTTALDKSGQLITGTMDIATKSDLDTYFGFESNE